MVARLRTILSKCCVTVPARFRSFGILSMFLLTFSNPKERGLVSPVGEDKFMASAPSASARAIQNNVVNLI